MSDYEPYEWQVGDPEDWGDSIGVPDIPYMGYLKDDDDEDPEKPPRRTYLPSKADILGEEAWELYEQFKDEEALEKIDEALSYNKFHASNWNRKGVILETFKRYEESKSCYDESLRLRKDNVVIDNKARMIYDWASGMFNSYRDFKKAAELLREAIGEMSTIETEENIGRYEDFIGLCEREYQHCRQNKRILSSYPESTFITIAGEDYHGPKVIFDKGDTLKLVKEANNRYDRDAIAVYFEGEKVGYVANSDSINADVSLKASDLKHIPYTAYCEYLMRYKFHYHIARIIE